MRDDLDDLLERMLPGSGHRSVADADAPTFPVDLGLQPHDILGRGSTGWVFRATDPVLDRQVAVKISRPDGGETVRTAMLAEARRTARLVHPAVLPVHRVAVADGLLCVVFQLAPRQTLAAALADWRSDPTTAWGVAQRLDLARVVVDAVATAHASDLVHGDLKPENIAVTSAGKPYVLDWGGLTLKTGTFSGTPRYAAPERLDGAAPTTDGDVWALGALVWELLTLRPLRTARAGREVGDLIAEWRRAPQPRVDDIAAVDPELATIVSAALGPAPRPTSAALRQAIERVLTGQAERQRRDRWAQQHLASARESMLRFHEGERRLQEERRVVAVQRTKVPAWAPEDDKLTLWSAEDRLADQLDVQAAEWTTAVEAALVAIAMQPGDDDIHQTLADIWYERWVMAEARGYAGEAALCLSRIHEHDRGRHRGLLEPTARLTVEVDTPGARCTVWRFDRRGRRLRAVPVHTGRIEALQLVPGSWLVTVDATGCEQLVHPVLLGRSEHRRARLRPLPAQAIGAGWIHVPEGPFRLGGDPVARDAIEPCTPTLPDLFARRTPVTVAEWIAFLADLVPSERAGHLPRDGGPFAGSRPIWPIAGGLPVTPAEAADWPVVGVTRDSARTYAAWVCARLGRPVRLPREEEWAKLARGADGRPFPWGHTFDPSFCHMRASRPGEPRPAPVGSVPTDTSVYGASDLAGGTREWTSTTWGDERVVVRGGGWRSDAAACRVAARTAHSADRPAVDIGFRLVSSAPASR